MTTVITKTTARVVAPIVFVVALSLLLQGHNLPGGGFIGGVLTVAGVALIYVAYGLDFVESGVLGREVEQGTGVLGHRSVAAFQRTFALGLVLAVASGVAGLAFDEPLMSQTFVVVESVPLYHEVELASALVFDVGVYAVVVGALLTVLSVVSAE
ncbi:MnhB domain-containing protein [Halorussus halobius]|uniref:MnhB domain-containing protein n=1 Tax=Halorussus halobius TaxID=1710537 RepID=UPI00109327F3|nr:MnhB domain-containing protein [Halorussus halobius]